MQLFNLFKRLALRINSFITKAITMKLTALIFTLFTGFSVTAQLSATSTSQLNTNCNGTDCDYTGPSILINELMISPSVNDGSISGPGGASAGRGEWIELYNPNLCESIDISCYYLGNNTSEGNGGFVIPPGTIIPPSGFCMVRGANVPAVPSNLLVQNGGNVVEVVVPAEITDPGVCASGTRLWFPNAGGWFAFYDYNGVAQDAVSWVSAAATAGTPCIPTFVGCNPAAALPSYDNIPANRKAYLTTPAILTLGSSVRRMPDGGSWGTQAAPTYALCNSTCIIPGSSSCTGTATINVSGGTPPYTYLWNDSQAQYAATAIDLCAGIYDVTVTDNLGLSAVFQVTVEDNVPFVTVNLQAEICINESPASIFTSPTAAVSQTGTITGTGVVGTNFNPSIAGVGNHTIQYYFEDEFGCNNTSTDIILVNPLPMVSITNNESPYCLSNIPAALVLSPSSGTLTGTGVVNNQFIPSQSGVGTFSLTYTFTDPNGCTNTTSIDVTVVGSNPPIIAVPSDLCIDAPTVTMVGTPSGGVFQINGVVSTNQFVPSTALIGNNIISYTTTDASGCIASENETIIVHQLPTIQLPINSAFCFETGFHSLNPQPTDGTLTGDNVIGLGIDVTAVIPGSYSFLYEFTDQFGCSNSATNTYIVTNPVQPNYAYETNCFQEATFIAINQSANQSVHWTISGNASGNGNSYTTMFANPGLYALTMTVTDSYGCAYDTVGVVDVPVGVSPSDFVVPNVITPNGDGVNDLLTMPSLLNDCFTYNIVILNRWGNVVFIMDSQSSVFDGHNKNGSELDAGVYFYYVESDDFDCDDDKFKGFCYGNITIQK